VRVESEKVFVDDPEDPLAVIVDLDIPEAQHREALLFQPIGAAEIIAFVGRVLMLRAIQFDDEFPCEADEIDDKWTEGLLSAELVPGTLAAAEMIPEEVLRIAAFTAQGTRDIPVSSVSDVCHGPSVSDYSAVPACFPPHPALPHPDRRDDAARVARQRPGGRGGSLLAAVRPGLPF
jgi:hypothetical protein